MYLITHKGYGTGSGAVIGNHGSRFGRQFNYGSSGSGSATIIICFIHCYDLRLSHMGHLGILWVKYEGRGDELWVFHHIYPF